MTAREQLIELIRLAGEECPEPMAWEGFVLDALLSDAGRPLMQDLIWEANDAVPAPETGPEWREGVMRHLMETDLECDVEWMVEYLRDKGALVPFGSKTIERWSIVLPGGES